MKEAQTDLLHRGTNLFAADSHFEGNEASRGRAIFVASLGMDFVKLDIT